MFLLNFRCLDTVGPMRPELPTNEAADVHHQREGREIRHLFRAETEQELSDRTVQTPAVVGECSFNIKQ